MMLFYSETKKIKYFLPPPPPQKKRAHGYERYVSTEGPLTLNYHYIIINRSAYEITTKVCIGQNLLSSVIYDV